jgi:hypothetical protein
MTRRLSRHAAADTLAPLGAAERCTLRLLARLPLLWVEALRKLSGHRGPATVYRELGRLRAMGLVGEVKASLQPGRWSALWYLSDLGLATIALEEQLGDTHPAPRNRRNRADLLALLPGLPHLVALYQLLTALAACGPGTPELLAWERPWRRRYLPVTAKTPATVELPAYAALSWDGQAAEYVLLPDLATFPLRAHRRTVSRLLAFRKALGRELPPLLIATRGHRRAAAWERMLREVCQARAEAPLLVHVACCDGLGTRSHELIALAHVSPLHAAGPAERPSARPLTETTLGGTSVRVVGAKPWPRLEPRTAGERLGLITLQMETGDREVLEIIGRHLFLPLDSLATVLGETSRRMMARLARLVTLGLVRRIGPEEVGKHATLQLSELTADGLALVAAQNGLSLPVAVRVNGLAGGGPGRPVGARRQLLRNLEHTLGADALFVSLSHGGHPESTLGRDDGLVEWRNAAACSRGRVRPDGYGIYRYQGELYGFFLEYDRGTMSGRDYRQKFTAYRDYLSSLRYEHDFDGFPTILVVTTNTAAEARIARAARDTGVEPVPRLSLLLTCAWRLEDARNPHGMLGPVWREPDADSGARRVWLRRPQSSMRGQGGAGWETL